MWNEIEMVHQGIELTSTELRVIVHALEAYKSPTFAPDEERIQADILLRTFKSWQEEEEKFKNQKTQKSQA